MPLRIDGLTAFEAMARHSDVFEGIRADATKAAQALIKKHLKDAGLEKLRATHAAFGEDTFGLVADEADDATLKAVLKKADPHNKEIQAGDFGAKRERFLALAMGRAEPVSKSIPAKLPKKAATPRKPPIERANNSRAMKAVRHT